MSLPVRGAWVEIEWIGDFADDPDSSLPVRGAWVEIALIVSARCAQVVAPRAGSVG